MGASGDVITYSYDSANRLTSVDGVGYTWDGNGHLLDDGVRTYTYDYANRLVQVVSGTLTTTYAYTGDGHRVAKTENGETTTSTSYSPPSHRPAQGLGACTQPPILRHARACRL